MNKPIFAKLAVIAALGAFGTFAGTANATVATGTNTFQVLMKINSSCSVAAGAGSNIQLGAAGGVAASAAVGATGTNNFSVTCSNKTPYNMALQSTNNSSNAGLGTLKGAISGNSDTITYQLNSGSATGPVWGNSGVTATATGNGLAGTGNGSAQSIPVFATATTTSVPNVTPDSYSDTVTITVNY